MVRMEVVTLGHKNGNHLPSNGRKTREPGVQRCRDSIITLDCLFLRFLKKNKLLPCLSHSYFLAFKKNNDTTAALNKYISEDIIKEVMNKWASAYILWWIRWGYKAALLWFLLGTSDLWEWHLCSIWVCATPVTTKSISWTLICKEAMISKCVSFPRLPYKLPQLW